MDVLSEHGFVIIRRAPTDFDVRALATRLGTIIQDDEVNKARKDPTNRAYTNEDIPWHTEKIYTQEMPSFILLQCIQPSLSGGRTLLLDGKVAAEKVLCRFPSFGDVRLEYHKPGMKGEWPLIGKHPQTGENVLWYRQTKANIRVVQGPNEIKEKIPDIIDQLLAETSPTYSHAWEKGDILVVDNHRMLHARESYEGERCLRRILVK